MKITYEYFSLTLTRQDFELTMELTVNVLTTFASYSYEIIII